MGLFKKLFGSGKENPPPQQKQEQNLIIPEQQRPVEAAAEITAAQALEKYDTRVAMLAAAGETELSKLKASEVRFSGVGKERLQATVQKARGLVGWFKEKTAQIKEAFKRVGGEEADYGDETNPNRARRITAGGGNIRLARTSSAETTQSYAPTEITPVDAWFDSYDPNNPDAYDAEGKPTMEKPTTVILTAGSSLDTQASLEESQPEKISLADEEKKALDKLAAFYGDTPEEAARLEKSRQEEAAQVAKKTEQLAHEKLVSEIGPGLAALAREQRSVPLSRKLEDDRLRRLRPELNQMIADNKRKGGEALATKMAEVRRAEIDKKIMAKVAADAETKKAAEAHKFGEQLAAARVAESKKRILDEVGQKAAKTPATPLPRQKQKPSAQPPSQMAT